MNRDNYPIEGSNEELKFLQLICALKQIKKHKGALFKAKRIKQPNDTAGKSKAMYQIQSRLPAVAEIFWWHPKPLTDNSLTYHPYLKLWEARKSHVLNSNSEAMGGLQVVLTKPFSADSCQQVLADLNADYYWIKEQLNFAPFAEQVRNYEAAFIQQLTETKAYFRDFFQVDSIFTLYQTTLIFKFDDVTDQIQRLTSISTYRAKLLSNLKNNQLIGADCRYVWKVFSNAIDFKLSLQLFIVRKIPESSYDDTKQDNRCKAIEAIAKEVAEKIKVTVQDEETEVLIPPSYCSSMPKKSMQQAKEDYFKAIDQYFLQAMWHPIHRVTCQNPKKMLFGKGNGKKVEIDSNS